MAYIMSIALIIQWIMSAEPIYIVASGLFAIAGSIAERK